MIEQEKINKYGYFGSRKLSNKLIITGISLVGCSLLLLSATDLFDHWPSFKQNKWELGAIGGNIWLTTKMWLGHFMQLRDQQKGAGAGA